jgi:hypothetical protein
MKFKKTSIPHDVPAFFASFKSFFYRDRQQNRDGHNHKHHENVDSQLIHCRQTLPIPNQHPTELDVLKYSKAKGA